MDGFERIYNLLKCLDGRAVSQARTGTSVTNFSHQMHSQYDAYTAHVSLAGATVISALEECRANFRGSREESWLQIPLYNIRS
jgi:hypothetical protein